MQNGGVRLKIITIQHFLNLTFRPSPCMALYIEKDNASNPLTIFPHRYKELRSISGA